MKVELQDEIGKHFVRLRTLAEDAAEDDDESYSSRAAAMTAMTNILKELTKTQQEVYNMERLMVIESVTIDTLRKYLTPAQSEVFIQDLTSRLDNVSGR